MYHEEAMNDQIIIGSDKLEIQTKLSTDTHA